MKTWIIRTLLRVYPASWSREYGRELFAILLARPLTAPIVFDVFRNGLWQRLRAAELSTRVGLAMSMVVLIGIVWNIAAPLPAAYDAIALLQRFGSNVWIIAGCWAFPRRGGWKLAQYGKTVMKVAFLGGLPVMAAGLLMLFGMLHVIVLGPGGIPASFHEHGFAFTFHSAHEYCWIRVSEPALYPWAHTIQSATCPPSPLGIFILPLTMLPGSFAGGVVAGVLERLIARHRRRSLPA